MDDIFDVDLFEAFKPTIENAKKIAIIGHKNIDGDCLGSTLAVAEFYEKLKKETLIIIPNVIPDFFKKMPETEKILIYNQSPWDAVTFISEADVIFMLDFSSFSRIDDLADAIEVADALKINIDHHQNPHSIADFAFVDPKSSSAAELVYKFLKIYDEKTIDKKIAEYIFLGLVSDTGSFMYASANSETFKNASELLSYDIDKEKIIDILYNNYSINRMRLLGHVINNNLVYLKDKNAAFISISLQDKEKFDYKPGDHENFVNFPLSISDVKFSVLFLENDDVVRISLRSKGDFDVNKIAGKYFSGGGHTNAAGGKSLLPLNETIDFFTKNIDEILKEGQS